MGRHGKRTHKVYKEGRVSKHAAGRQSTPAKKVPNRELEGDVAVLNAVTAAKGGVQVAEKNLTASVRRARRAGVSWTRIAQALGVTQQAASRRWGPYPIVKGQAPRKPRTPRRVEVQGALEIAPPE